MKIITKKRLKERLDIIEAVAEMRRESIMERDRKIQELEHNNVILLQNERENRNTIKALEVQIYFLSKELSPAKRKKLHIEIDE